MNYHQFINNHISNQTKLRFFLLKKTIDTEVCNFLKKESIPHHGLHSHIWKFYIVGLG